MVINAVYVPVAIPVVSTERAIMDFSRLRRLPLVVSKVSQSASSLAFHINGAHPLGPELYITSLFGLGLPPYSLARNVMP